MTPVKNESPYELRVIPLPTTIPFRAVISPTASTFVTSSYVNVPAIETVPPIETSLTKFTVPPTERTLSEAFNVAIVVTPAN